MSPTSTPQDHNLGISLYSPLNTVELFYKRLTTQTFLVSQANQEPHLVLQAYQEPHLVSKANQEPHLVSQAYQEPHLVSKANQEPHTRKVKINATKDKPLLSSCCSLKCFEEDIVFVLLELLMIFF